MLLLAISSNPLSLSVTCLWFFSPIALGSSASLETKPLLFDGTKSTKVKVQLLRMDQLHMINDDYQLDIQDSLPVMPSMFSATTCQSSIITKRTLANFISHKPLLSDMIT